MKNTLIIALLGFSISIQAAEDKKINLNNANNDALSLFLSYVPAEHPIVSELARTRNCNSDLYDRIIEAYLSKVKRFYIEEKDIKKLIYHKFYTCAANKVNPEVYHNHIKASLLKYIAKHPYSSFIKCIETLDVDNTLYENLKPVCSLFRYWEDFHDANKVELLTDNDLIEIKGELKKEKIIVDNLIEFEKYNKKRIIANMFINKIFTDHKESIISLTIFSFLYIYTIYYITDWLNGDTMSYRYTIELYLKVCFYICSIRLVAIIFKLEFVSRFIHRQHEDYLISTAVDLHSKLTNINNKIERMINFIDKLFEEELEEAPEI